MKKSNIFLFEFVSGGGFNQVDIPTSLFCEGYGMLRSIIADFKLLDFEISTLLDYRIQKSLSKYLKADFIEQVESHDNYIKKFKKFVKETEYCFIIAPEFSNILFDLTKIVKDNDKKLLSVDLEGIKLGTSKIKTYKFFKANNANTPRTYLIPSKNGKLDKDYIIQKFKKLKSPIVIKPEDGVGAENIFYFESKQQIIDFFYDQDENLEIRRNFILQEFIEGRDLSVSLIGNSNNHIILSVNAQNLQIKNLKGESEYFGGHTPVENYKQISNTLNILFDKINLSKFSGYYGIDFIEKADKSIYFIEINPRLTTSYIGIRNVIDNNPAELIWDAKLKSLSSSEIHLKNFSQFSRIELNYLDNETELEVMNNTIPILMKEIPELVTPPIKFHNSNHDKNIQYSCFIATKTKDSKSSKKRMTEIVRVLKRNNFTLLNQ